MSDYEDESERDIEEFVFFIIPANKFCVSMQYFDQGSFNFLSISFSLVDRKLIVCFIFFVAYVENKILIVFFHRILRFFFLFILLQFTKFSCISRTDGDSALWKT